MTKKTNPAIFYILKSLVDRQVPELHQQVKLGEKALERINILDSQIDSAEKCIMINGTYDRDQVNECRADIETYKIEKEDLQKFYVKPGDAAREQLIAAKQFNNLYKNDIVLPAREHARKMELRRQIAMFECDYRIAERAAMDAECLVYTQRDYVDAIMAEPESPERTVLEQYREDYNRKLFKMKQIGEKISQIKNQLIR